MLEVRRGTMNGATVAILGVLSAVAGLLRLLDLPGGGSGIFFLVVLAGAAFGPRFGLLLGLCAMAVSAIVTGGIGPWLPFQMLALAWMGGGAGLRRPAHRAGSTRALEVVVLAAYGWVWGFVYGAIMNLWFWPFARGGALDWHPGLGLARDPAPLLVVLRGHVARLGRRRRASPTRCSSSSPAWCSCAPSAASPTASTPPSSSIDPPDREVASLNRVERSQVTQPVIRDGTGLEELLDELVEGGAASGVVTSPTKTAARVSSDSSARAVSPRAAASSARPTSTTTFTCAPPARPTPPGSRTRAAPSRTARVGSCMVAVPVAIEREHQEPRVAQQRTDREVTLRRRRAEAVARSTVVAHDPAHEHDREHGEGRPARASSATRVDDQEQDREHQLVDGQRRARRAA